MMCDNITENVTNFEEANMITMSAGQVIVWIIIGGLAGALGGGGGQVANIAALAGGFSQLGLSPAMISKFVPVILSFTKSQGGEQVMNILAGVLK